MAAATPGAGAGAGWRTGAAARLITFALMPHVEHFPAARLLVAAHAPSARSSAARAVVLAACLTLVAACASAPRRTAPVDPTAAVAAPPATVAPPAAGSPAATPAAPSADGARPRANAADVQFMQHMMAHHAQALIMTAMVPSHGAGNAVRLMAERIEVSQRDELALMRRWLADRGAPVPSVDAAPPAGRDMEHDHTAHDPAMPGMPGMAHDAGAMPMMPGMLTPAELARLGQATGAAFDRLFLTSMIRHHEGALTMVAGFFATRGAGQDSEIFRFASDVDADQRAEIRRMRTLLGTS